MHVYIKLSKFTIFILFLKKREKNKVRNQNSQTVKILFEQVKLNIVSRCIKGFFLTCR